MKDAGFLFPAEIPGNSGGPCVLKCPKWPQCLVPCGSLLGGIPFSPSLPVLSWQQGRGQLDTWRDLVSLMIQRYFEGKGLRGMSLHPCLLDGQGGGKHICRILCAAEVGWENDSLSGFTFAVCTLLYGCSYGCVFANMSVLFQG